MKEPIDCVLVIRGDEVLLPVDRQQPLAAALSRVPQNIDPDRLHFVDRHEDRAFSTTWVDAGWQAPPGLGFFKLRALLNSADPLFGLAGKAFQVSQWARTHRFCGACGAPTVPAATERCMKCTACDWLAFPRISPAMIVLIRRGDHILLARHDPNPASRFAPLAGFLEAGETLEEAVHREVAEEVGLRVTNLRYFASQAWPFPHTLLAAFMADYLGGDVQCSAEIAAAEWFDLRQGLPNIPPPQTVSGALILAALGQAGGPP